MGSAKAGPRIVLEIIKLNCTAELKIGNESLVFSLRCIYHSTVSTNYEKGNVIYIVWLSIATKVLKFSIDGELLDKN